MVAVLVLSLVKTASPLLQFKKHLSDSLTFEQRKELKKFLNFRFRGLQDSLYRFFVGSDLKALADIYGTDKWGSHFYAQHYETHFAPLRRKNLNILEIGIGGYSNPEEGGESLRMWRTYFPNARIFGIDIHDKSGHDERRIKTFKGSQVDEDFLKHVIKEIDPIDIVIDDGSHVNEHVIHTFKFLFPRIQCQWYVIEDTQTSYWPGEYGGMSDDLNNLGTSMGFLKHLIDGLNYVEYKIDGYEPTYFDQHIVAMHFYHNIVFIEKE
ncbi:MAG: hypothetical protein KME35_23515 [Aphanocapsa sp. GSE-SYN-MK-11-07L]|jgi:hypothetical protein|nr:hypothetical protein [Aphanocapsa sp. GSE-SYN-MK-11-07L]